MATIVTERLELNIPRWVSDLSSFRRWVHDPKFPEKIPTWWLRGEAWIDFCRQSLSHVVAKGAMYSGLLSLIDFKQTGYFFGSGVFFSNIAADLAGNPDGLFISHEGLRSRRVRFLDVVGDGKDFDEVQGTPDMVLEVVNYSTVKKDLELVFEPYWIAGIPEYWLVDVRKPPLRFDIWWHTADGYVAARKKDGWVKSNVFGKSFRLVDATDSSKLPTYKLEVR